ncbi:MAG: MarR family transcriptional regulator [Candidatus Hydrogenedentes bacterium]|nr:MarR family transcriptional regulator [Candidatus Hydrogenedentota bacterium]
MPLAKELNLDLPFEDVRHETVLSVVHTATMLAAAGDELFRKFKLTEAQFNVLLVLKYKRGKLTQTDLGHRLVVTRASITSVLDRLEAKGLTERKDVPDDRRTYHVELTKRGKATVEKIEPIYRDTIHQVTAALNEADCAALNAFLERVRVGINEGLAAGPRGPKT